MAYVLDVWADSGTVCMVARDGDRLCAQHALPAARRADVARVLRAWRALGAEIRAHDRAAEQLLSDTSRPH